MEVSHGDTWIESLTPGPSPAVAGVEGAKQKWEELCLSFVFSLLSSSPSPPLSLTLTSASQINNIHFKNKIIEVYCIAAKEARLSLTGLKCRS